MSEVPSKLWLKVVPFSENTMLAHLQVRPKRVGVGADISIRGRHSGASEENVCTGVGVVFPTRAECSDAYLARQSSNCRRSKRGLWVYVEVVHTARLW